jgi:hypothetical protein
MKEITLREEDARKEDQINLERSPEFRMSAGGGGGEGAILRMKYAL